MQSCACEQKHLADVCKQETEQACELTGLK